MILENQPTTMNKMKIKFLGTGGVLDVKWGNSSALVHLGPNLILIDCGATTYSLLSKSNKIAKVTHILITHLHGDHISGLFQLIVHMNLRLQDKHKAVILYPTESFREHISAFLKFWFPDFESQVEFQPVREVLGVGAIDTTGKHVHNLPSFSYFFHEDNRLIYYSGDIGNVSIAADFLLNRTESDILVFHEIHHLEGFAHTYFRDVMERLSKYRVFGYHCNPEKMPPENKVPLVVEAPEFVFMENDDGSALN